MESNCIDCLSLTEKSCDNCGEPCCCGDNYYNEEIGNCYLCENCGNEIN